jgi:hypothetical protein
MLKILGFGKKEANPVLTKIPETPPITAKDQAVSGQGEQTESDDDLEAKKAKEQEAQLLKDSTLELASTTLTKLNDIIDANFSSVLHDSMHELYNRMITDRLHPELNELFRETKIGLERLNNEYKLDFLNGPDEMRSLSFYSKFIKNQIGYKLNEVKNEYKSHLSKPLHEKIVALANKPRAIMSDFTDATDFLNKRVRGGNLSRFSKKRRKPRKKRRVTKKNKKKLN